MFVFLFHYPNLQPSEIVFSFKEFGWTGVDLFFVLSGFLIASHVFAEVKKTNKIDVKKFFIKRAFRILPAYLFIVAIYFLLPAFREKESLPPLWKFLTFTQNIALDGDNQGTFSHAWSLCIEEQFYFSFPLIIAAFAFLGKTKKVIYLVISLFIITCLIRLIIWNKYMIPLEEVNGNTVNFWLTWIYYPTYTRLDGLLTGIAVAWLFAFLPITMERFTRHGNVLLLIGIAGIIGCSYLTTDRLSFHANILGFPLIALCYGFIVTAAISPGCVLSKIKSRFITNLAILSYSIYLSHKGIIHLCQQYFVSNVVKTDSYSMFFIAVIFSVIAALIVRHIIEKPFLKARDLFLRK